MDKFNMVKQNKEQIEFDRKVEKAKEDAKKLNEKNRKVIKKAKRVFGI